MGLACLVAAVTALARWRPLAFTLRTLLGVLLIAVAGLLAWEQSLVSADDLSQVKRAFDMNGYVGILYLVTTALAVYVGA